MMIRYMTSYFLSQRYKTTALVVSLSIYFAVLLIAFVLLRAIPDIAALPLKSIGVQTIVQKTGEIPEQMIGVVFPHSNAPISEEEYQKLSTLEFTESAEAVLFFWFFDESYFKAVSGIKPESDVAKLIIDNSPNTVDSLRLNDAIITSSLSERQNLAIGDSIVIGHMTFTVRDVLEKHPSANIVASDIYISFQSAFDLATASPQITNLYSDISQTVGNVVLLKTNPSVMVDKETAVKDINKKLIVFSEQSFTEEVNDQLALVSNAGQTLLGIVGTLLIIAFCLLVFYNLKTRETEIATLRKIGWKLADLRLQFGAESAIILATSLLLGNVMAFIGFQYLKQTTIELALPWDITAKPHFLMEENAIDRTIEAALPVNYEPIIAVLASGAMFAFFISISLLIFQQLKNIKPYDMAK